MLSPQVCNKFDLEYIFDCQLITTKGICKVSAKALKNLAIEEDVSDLLNIYAEYFETNLKDEDELPILDTLPESKQLNNNGDFGMEVEVWMSIMALAIQLGFPSGLPLQFNTLHHMSGILPWDNYELFMADPLPPDLDKMKLHWHQPTGVHSMLHSLFTNEMDPTHTTGILIGDKVGLGKTAQAITLLGFLNQVILVQSANQNLPQVLGE